MFDATTSADVPTGVTLSAPRTGRLGLLLFAALLAGGVGYVGMSLVGDLNRLESTGALPYVLLILALFVALAFEFVNGFHDTANAVATVIYTHSLNAHAAVIWSGLWNFIGVLASSGAVAFGIVSLLPVELILQVGGTGGFAMVFALLTAAILWNLGTWYLGLPSSSSHTLIGSILGVGIANQLMSAKTGTSGVDWSQAVGVGRALFLSPLIGFVCAATLLLVAKKLIPNPALYESPEGTAPPPFWIRSLLILTCTGVSFAHGSNDGQKGMGLIMLILIGTVPPAYALNHAVSPRQVQDFIAVSRDAATVIAQHAESDVAVAEPRTVLTEFLRTRVQAPNTLAALSGMVREVSDELVVYRELRSVPPERVRNFRNDLYVINESMRLLQGPDGETFTASEQAVLANYRRHVDSATKFIPTWVKVAVAIALGLGTMIGWKRIVVTVGEKIGKSHLTYAQGAAAELTAMTTIAAADIYGLPVSTTHVLASGVAGTMAANRSGLQWGTVRNLAMAWVLTLPASIVLSAVLFWTFRTLAA